jgi:hypothetical protein
METAVKLDEAGRFLLEKRSQRCWQFRKQRDIVTRRALPRDVGDLKTHRGLHRKDMPERIRASRISSQPAPAGRR